MDIYNSVGFIDRSLAFPPYRAKERLDAYEHNLKLYKGGYSADSKLTIQTANGKKILDFKKPRYNFYKIITDKLCGLILNEKPIITASDDATTEALNKVIDNVGFYRVLNDALKSYSTLGDMVLYVDSGTVNVVNPSFYYKVVEQCNIDAVKCHVLVQPIYEENYYDISIDDKITHLRVLYCYKGYMVERYYSYDGAVIGSAVDYTLEDGEVVSKEGRRIETGLKGFNVFTAHNSKTVDSCWGISDYKIIEDVVSLIEKKVALYDLITDKHSEPILQSDISNFRQNEETGATEFKGVGNVLAVRSGGAESKYITWDGNLDKLLDFIKFNIDNVAMLSEFGKVFLLGEFSSGNVSGETIKSMAKSVLDKASRCIDSVDFTVKEVLCALCKSEGVDIRPSDISIRWQDGVSDSDLVVAQTIATRVGAGTMSVERALMQYDNMSKQQADVEVSKIKVRGEDSEVKGITGVEHI